MIQYYYYIGSYLSMVYRVQAPSYIDAVSWLKVERCVLPELNHLYRARTLNESLTFQVGMNKSRVKWEIVD